MTTMTDYDILASSLVLVGCLAKRKRTISRRVQKRLDMELFRHFGTVFVKEHRETGKVVQKPCLFIAKFHYTDPRGPERTGPDQTKSAHIVGVELNCTTRARPDPTGPAQTRTDPHGPNGPARTLSETSTDQRSFSEIRVRSGPSSGI